MPIKWLPCGLNQTDIFRFATRMAIIWYVMSEFGKTRRPGFLRRRGCSAGCAAKWAGHVWENNYEVRVRHAH